jgi:hypothetical protein
MRCGQNETSGGGRITPLSADAARAWLEEHDEVAAIEEHFADEVADA